jgi:glycerol-3-phosphate acyltransferase PlsY
MLVLLFLSAAAAAYLVGSVNPAIILSRSVYRKDVRRFGSRNPGFTNFHRVFGGSRAWSVFLLDFAKSAIVCLVFCPLFRNVCGLYHLGAAYTSLFTLLGHAFPLWHGFEGGKGVSVMFAAVWFIDWRAGVVIVVVFLALMLTTRYMSLSVLCAAATAPVTMAVAGTEHIAVWILTTVSVLFMFWRHRENLRRLRQGTESKFSLRGHGSPPPKS